MSRTQERLRRSLRGVNRLAGFFRTSREYAMIVSEGRGRLVRVISGAGEAGKLVNVRWCLQLRKSTTSLEERRFLNLNNQKRLGRHKDKARIRFVN